MTISQFLVGSLTSIVLANSPNLPPSNRTMMPKTAEKYCLAFGSSTLGAIPADSTTAIAGASRVVDWQSLLSENGQSILELRHGWDGPGSLPISSTTVSLAMFHVGAALGGSVNMVAPRLVPGGDGSIQVEWHAKHAELEFSIDSQGGTSIWIRDHLSGAEFDGEDEKALALFYRWAPWVASRQRHASHASVASQMASLAVAA